LLYGQPQQANIWYFGSNAGLDFSTNPPSPLLNSNLSTVEGCASICNPQGQLIFYTDGSNVWNANHQIMPNGSGLLGDVSSTQSAIIIPWPSHPHLFYIFTVDNIAGPNGLQYSVVDMSLNQGLGDISIKNVPLLSSTTEKITAVKHANGFDVWLIAHPWNSNTFHVYKVTSNGVDTSSVVSQTGSIHQGSSGNNIGYMKAAPTGKKLALAIRYMNQFEVFDFDSQTGIVSNPLTLPTHSNAYGIAFSPDGNKLYATYLGGLVQYDLSQPTDSAILASETLIANANVWAMQLANDGKIYVADYFRPSLSIIQSPNRQGAACNFQLSAQSLSGRVSNLGLPTFMQSFFKDFDYQHTCFGDSTDFFILDTTGISTVQWTFGDSLSPSTDTSYTIFPKHQYSVPGTYTVTLTRHYGNSSPHISTQQIRITPSLSPINIGNDTTICLTESYYLSADSGYTSYQWSNNQFTQAITVDSSANPLSLIVRDTAGCEAHSNAIHIYQVDDQPPLIVCPPNINHIADSSICGANLAIPSPFIIENCTGYILTNSYTNTSNASAFYPLGDTTINWRVIDGAGNDAICTQYISIRDSLRFPCPNNISSFADNQNCGKNVSFPPPIAYNSCGAVSTTQLSGQASGSFFPLGRTHQQYRAIDSLRQDTQYCNFEIDIRANIDAGSNITKCPTDTCPRIRLHATLQSCPSSYLIDSLGCFSPLTIPNNIPTHPIPLGDDELSPALPIGFPFQFFNQTYETFYLSSNGFLTFSNSLNNGCCSGQMLPNPLFPNNLIAFAWEDLHPNYQGIHYALLDSAPYRKLVIDIKDVRHFGSAISPNITTQLILYESTNIIELHTESMRSNGGNHTMGIENQDGTLAYTVPNRNANPNWNAYREHIAFIPQWNNHTYQWFQNDSLISSQQTLWISPQDSSIYRVEANNGSLLSIDSTQFVQLNACPDVCGRDIFEPNNTFSQAKPLPSIGLKQNARICPTQDEDYFLYIPQDSGLFLHLHDFLGDLDLFVYNTNQQLIASAETRSNQQAESLYLSSLSPNDSLFVLIKGNDNSYSSEQAYQLTLRSFQETNPIRLNNKPPTLSPNPFSNQLSLIANDQIPPFTLYIYAPTGQLLHQSLHQVSQSSYNIPLPPLPKGIYLWQINTPNHRYQGKIVRE